MQIDGVLATDAGLFGMWSPEAFRDVVDYATWEAALLEDEDIARHIAAGAFVPVNIGSDGAFELVARVGSAGAPAGLTERERRYRLVSSEPYLFVSAGTAVISGIEAVRATVDEGLSFALPAGRWGVTVHLIGWDDEPGQADAAGHPLPTALPDFAVLINPEGADAGRYRTAVETFDR